MISDRAHFAALLRAERERASLLFAAAWGLAAFVYFELGRRQRLGETREESRRRFVDGELARLGEGELGHVARAEQVQKFGRILVGLATVALGYVGLHQIGAI